MVNGAGQGIDRRRALALAGSAAALAATSARASGLDPLSGDALFADVRAYDALGVHRTATPGDEATSRWLVQRMRGAGLTTTLQSFAAPLFEPERCSLAFGGSRVEAFPAWPVAPTASMGLQGALAPGEGGDLAGRIAIVRIPYGPGASWAAPRAGDAVQGAIKRDAAAVVAVTEGPTGEVIALNTEPGRFEWPVPVVIAGGRDGAALDAAASAGAKGRLLLVGRSNPAARATNVVGRRPGDGKAIVVTTPKSGWFHCAGERGSGIAVFLGLAAWLVRHTSADLTFAATSGHEHGYAGGAEFLRIAPRVGETRVWMHIGANVALQELTISGGRVTGTGKPVVARGVSASEALIPIAAKAFERTDGYNKPRVLSAANAAGELQTFHAAGYDNLIGLLGANTLFHTPLDRADVATTPEILAPVAGGCRDLLASFA